MNKTGKTKTHLFFLYCTLPIFCILGLIWGYLIGNLGLGFWFFSCLGLIPMLILLWTEGSVEHY